MPSTVSRRLIALLLAAFASCALAADDGKRIDQLERRLEESQRLIERLAARIAELERAVGPVPQAASAAMPAASAVTAAPPASAPPSGPALPIGAQLSALQADVEQITEGLSRRSTDTGIAVHGFADVGAAQSNGNDPERLRGFNVGTLELYLTPQFGNRVKSLFELAFEMEADGRSVLELERMQLGYTVSDSLSLWAGRFHTPFGLWNTAFHHGANLQTAITRPRFIEFEDKGGIIPTHSVGVWATGKTTLGPGKLTYDAYIANGPRTRDRSLDFNAFTDDSPGKMLGLNVGYQPNGTLRGLTVGLHAFGSTVNAYTTDDRVFARSRLRAAGGYLGYDANDWEVLAEYYRFGNSDVSGGARRSSEAWYAQVGRTFSAWTPFARYELASIDPLDTYFTAQERARPYNRAVVGARYALDAHSSFKVELSRTRERAIDQFDGNGLVVPFGGARYDRAAFQYSIAF